MAMRLPLPFRNRAQPVNRAAMINDTTTMGYATNSPHFRDYNTYLQAFKFVPWVRPCVSVIAFVCSNVAFKVVKRPAVDDDDQDEGPGVPSPFIDLFTHPNPFMTGFELREKIFIDLELTGNCFISLEQQNSGGLPAAMFRLQPDRVAVIPDPIKGISHYRYTANGRTIDYAPEEMWHLKYPHPFDDLYGMGTIEAMEQRADSSRAIAEHEAKFWQSGAKITGVLTTPQTVDQTIWDRILSNFRRFSRDSGFSTLLLEQGLDYKAVSESPLKLGLLELTKMGRDEILAFFGVPPTKVGILENANYKAEASDEFFRTETVDPKLTRFEQSAEPLVRRFHGDGYVLRFARLNFSDDLVQAQIAEGMQRTFSLTVNEIREYQGKEKVAAGEIILIAGRGMPVAFDPVTGEATVLGGPAPGSVQVDESGNGLPIQDAGAATMPPVPPTPKPAPSLVANRTPRPAPTRKPPTTPTPPQGAA
jgi:HK97 family phage portal protein